MSKKLFTKVVSLSLTAAMVLSMAPVNASAAKAVKPKSMKAPKASKIKVGQTKTITASRKSKKSTNDVKYVNFKPAKTKNIGIGVKTSDDTIVSVEKVSNGKYTYTGVNTGTATLTITSRAKTAKGKKLQAKLDVTVINPFKVTQTGAYTFTMSTADKLEKVDKRDVKVTQEGNTVDNAVKSVKLSEDKMSVEVTMEIPFVDQQKYNVEFGKEKDSFVASVGAPAAINIKTQSVVINKPTAVEYAVVDAKGMDVTKVIDESKLSLEVTVKTGYYDGKKLTMWKVGDTAEAKVTYHTWTYDQKTGKENVVEGKGTITAVDKSAVTVVGLDKWTIADKVLSWDTDEMRTVLPKDQNKKLFVRMKKSDGTYIDNKKSNLGFTFDPVNASTLFVFGNTLRGNKEEVVEYVKVTYFDGTVKYEYTLPVTVGAVSKAASLVLGQSFVVVSKNSAAPANMVTLKVLDQYGSELEAGVVLSAKHLSGKNVANIAFADTNKAIKKVSVKGNGTDGSGIYQITATQGMQTLNITMTVNASDVSSAPVSYQLKADVNEFDATITEETTDLNDLAEGVALKIYGTKAGLLENEADALFNTKIAANPDNNIFVNGIPASENLIKWDVANNVYRFTPVVKDNDDNYVVTAPSGSYNITIKVDVNGDGKDEVIGDSIVVKNTTKTPSSESYGIKDYIEVNDTLNAFMSKIVESKIGAATLNKPENYAKILFARNGSPTNTSAAGFLGFDFATDKNLYLDTAALPSFKTDTGKFIWIMQTALNKKLNAKESALEVKADTTYNPIHKMVFGGTETNKWTLEATADLNGILPAIKIYAKGDSTKTDLVGKAKGFENVALVNIAAGKVDFEVQQKNDTLAGEYVGEMTVVKGTTTLNTTFVINVAKKILSKDDIFTASPTITFTDANAKEVDLTKATISMVENEEVEFTKIGASTPADDTKVKLTFSIAENGKKLSVKASENASGIKQGNSAGDIKENTALGNVILTLNYDDNHTGPAKVKVQTKWTTTNGKLDFTIVE